MKMRSFAFSPSLHHRHALDALQPALAYSGGDVKAWQRRLRARLRVLLGSWPSERVPLDVRTLWRRETPLGSIEKIVFTSEPRCDVPAYICLPRAGKPPYPCMICLQGHTSGMHNSIAVRKDDENQPLEVPGDRDYAVQCLQYGFAALCLEQRSLGERRELVQQHKAPNICQDAMLQALMLGRTLVGERVYDVDRGIDVLAQRGDMDLHRIGVMGNSGGGTTSVYAAALLPRLACAMPSCSFCTFRDSKMALNHCACGYLPGVLRYAEMADILGLFAPRPVVVVAGKDDPIIPLAGVRKAFRHLRAIYRAAGATGNCRLVVGPEGHRFYADAAWPVFLRILSSHRTPQNHLDLMARERFAAAPGQRTFPCAGPRG